MYLAQCRCPNARHAAIGSRMSITTILLVVLIIILLGGVSSPYWYPNAPAYGPPHLWMTVLVVVLLLKVLGEF